MQGSRRTGFRGAEVSFFTWADFNPRKGTVSVTGKADLGFRTKSHEERTIPIPDELTNMLLNRRERYPEDHFVFGTGHRWNSAYIVNWSGGRPDTKMLPELKSLARKQELNCGRCTAMMNEESVSCKDHPVCWKWVLHKFRHTYTTRLLQDDVVTVQNSSVTRIWTAR